MKVAGMEGSVTPGRLNAALQVKADVRIVDVRTAAEFEASHIEGSYNVPLDALRRHGRSLGGVADAIVLVCESGQRSREAWRKLRALGVRQLHVLEGGLHAWRAAGLPVREGRAVWALDRQVRLIAGGLAFVGAVAGLFVPALLVLPAVAGAGLAHAAITDTCALGIVLRRLPYNRGRFSAAAAEIDRLREDSLRAA